MNVLKFGGTSVANDQNIKKVIEIISKKAKENNNNLAIVVSAFSGVTDLLLLASHTAASKKEHYKSVLQQIQNKHYEVVENLIEKDKKEQVINLLKTEFNQLQTLLDGCYLLSELTPKTADRILSFGELLASQIIAVALQKVIPETEFKDSREVLKTNATFGKATVDFKTTNTLINAFFKTKPATILVFPGFIASSTNGNTTTLGRGGSDYTAAILAAALQASTLEIWTDVNGMYTANPKIVKQAQPIPSITYQEAMELSHFGAKVLYPPTIQPVLDLNIPIWIKNTFEPDAFGTLISNQSKSNGNPIKGISHIESIALITLEGSGMIGVSGSSKRLFETKKLIII